MLRAFAGLALTVSVAGCGAVHSPLPPALQERVDMAFASPPPSAAASPVGTMTAGVITRQFAGPQTYLAPMPTAVVLLRRDQESRNNRFCSEYVQQDGLADMGSQGGSAANMLLVRWPLAAPELESSPTDCDRMMRNYDFTRTASLIDAFAETERGTLGTVGPHILVMYPDGGAILIDGSAVPTNELAQWSTGWVRATQPPAAASASGADWANARRAAYGALSSAGSYGNVLVGALR